LLVFRKFNIAALIETEQKWTVYMKTVPNKSPGACFTSVPAAKTTLNRDGISVELSQFLALFLRKNVILFSYPFQSERD
jgi:hypothetical protein